MSRLKGLITLIMIVNQLGFGYRFTSVDPKRQFVNSYSYVGNNPVRFVDPTGEELAIDDSNNLQHFQALVGADLAQHLSLTEGNLIDPSTMASQAEALKQKDVDTLSAQQKIFLKVYDVAVHDQRVEVYFQEQIKFELDSGEVITQDMFDATNDYEDWGSEEPFMVFGQVLRPDEFSTIVKPVSAESVTGKSHNKSVLVFVNTMHLKHYGPKHLTLTLGHEFIHAWRALFKPALWKEESSVYEFEATLEKELDKN